jgi:hypothetical protein
VNFYFQKEEAQSFLGDMFIARNMVLWGQMGPVTEVQHRLGELGSKILSASETEIRFER